MVIKGYESAVNISVVTNPSSFSSESMSLISGTHKWKIDDTTKSLFMVGEKPTVYDDGVEIDSDLIDVDYLFGTVEIDTAAYGEPGTITSDGYYYDTLSVMTGAKQIDLTLNDEIQDSTDFTSTGYKSKTNTLKEATFSIVKYIDNTTYVEGAFYNSDMIVIEWVLGVEADDVLSFWDDFANPWDTYTEPFGVATPTTIRALCVLSSMEESGDASAVNEYSIELELGNKGKESTPISIWTI